MEQGELLMPKTVIREWLDASLDGMSPQQAIRMFTDVVNRTKLDDRRYLRIEAYKEDFCNPFEQNPTRCLRIVLDKPKNNG
jgi:hypothetical protein